MKKEWFILIDDRREGPFNLEDLRHDYRITPDTLVWKEGFEKWIPIRDIDELKSLFEDSTPLPNEDENEEEDEENGNPKGKLKFSHKDDDIVVLTFNPFYFWLWVFIIILVVFYAWIKSQTL